MRIHSVVAIFILVLASLIFSNFAVAQTRQTVVIGIGLGIHSYSEVDDVRNQFYLSTPEAGGMGVIFGEWYPLENIGVGIRSLAVAQTETIISGGFQLDTTATTTATLLTATLIPWVSSDGYYRAGIVAGAGSATYEVTQTLGALSASIDTSGTAVLGGGYIDWGADGFGARFGANYLSTTFDPLVNGSTELSVDGSGTHWYFDLRWAFE